MGLFTWNAKGHGTTAQKSAREEAAREEAAREDAAWEVEQEEQSKAYQLKIDRAKDELAKEEFGEYTNVFNRASARSQAKDVYAAMNSERLTPDEQKKKTNEIQDKIKSAMDELHKRCNQNDAYVYETQFIRNYLLGQNPKYVVEALNCLREIAGVKLNIIAHIQGNAEHIIALEHSLRNIQLQNCKHDDEKATAELEQEEWAHNYDTAYAEADKDKLDADKYKLVANTNKEEDLRKLINKAKQDYDTKLTRKNSVHSARTNFGRKYHVDSDDIERRFPLTEVSRETETARLELQRLQSLFAQHPT